VLVQAGEINIGSFDDFPAITEIAQKHGAWVHVDGAFGLWAAASPRYQHLMKGAALCDSWATDGHKWLNVPFDSGYAFVAHTESHRLAMTYRAPYLTHASETRDQMEWNPEWSRRARGFATYAALRELGREGVAALVDRCCQHATAIVAGIGKLPGAEVLWSPTINQGLVRFLDLQNEAPESKDTNSKSHDHFTDEVIAAINKTGEAFFGGTTWRGKRAMRVSVCNWRTTEEDVERTIRAAEQVLATMGNRSEAQHAAKT
jgi:glutamate/tyrosine decarboxylase-like PLP-dependent enzyme